MSEIVTPVRVFISGACAGLAEVRQALGTHPEIEIVGTAVEPARAAQKLAAANAQVVLHGSSRTDRMPVEDVEAIRQATSAPIVLVTTSSATGLLQEALSHGVADIVLLPQLTDALVFTIRRAFVMSAQRGRSAGATHIRRGTEGKIISVFSPKGGVGRTTLACGLATIFARRHGRRTLLIDLDLQFGDAAIMMGLDPAKTIYDLVMTSGDLDPDKLASSVNVHPSGVHVIPAPVRPEDAELVAEDRVANLLEVAKQAYDVIVVDTPAQFHATTLATLDRTDRLALVGSLDIPTVKNIKLTLQTLGMLHYPTERIGFVMNRPQPRVELKQSEVEKALDLKVIGEVPYDREIPIAVNRGVPVPMSAPRSSASKALEEVAHALLPPPASGKNKLKVKAGKAPKGRKAELAAVEAPAPLAIGDGKPKRQSILTKLRKAA
jgi:pilus assembly protein CpaE